MDFNFIKVQLKTACDQTKAKWKALGLSPQSIYYDTSPNNSPSNSDDNY